MMETLIIMTAEAALVLLKMVSNVAEDQKPRRTLVQRFVETQKTMDLMNVKMVIKLMEMDDLLYANSRRDMLETEGLQVKLTLEIKCTFCQKLNQCQVQIKS